jgi:hypothetical protein
MAGGTRNAMVAYSSREAQKHTEPQKLFTYFAEFCMIFLSTINNGGLVKNIFPRNQKEQQANIGLRSNWLFGYFLGKKCILRQLLTLLPAAYLFALVLGLAFSFTHFASAAQNQEGDVIVNYNSPALTLVTNKDTVSMSIMPSLLGTMSSNFLTATVTTNSISGYYLTISTTAQNGGTDGDLTLAPTHALTPVNGTIVSPIVFSSSECNEWGFAVGNLDHGNSIGIANGWNDSYVVQDNVTVNDAVNNVYRWAAAPAVSGTPAILRNQTRNMMTAQTDLTDIYFGACAGGAGGMPTSGAYLGTVTLTAVLNDIPDYTPLSALPAGSVIDLGDGHPWLWVGSTAQTGTKSGYGYIMAMYNYGNYAWGSKNTTPTTAINTTADTGAIYTNLPATIGGIAKADAFATNTWQWDNCSTANPTVCADTVTSNSRLSFVSFREWQGGTGGYNTEPTSGSVGNLFCYAWKGTACLGSNLNSTFGYPWSRSGYSVNSNYAWRLHGDASDSLSPNHVSDTGVSLPVAWLSSSIAPKCGSGTYADPYKFDGCS